MSTKRKRLVGILAGLGLAIAIVAAVLGLRGPTLTFKQSDGNAAEHYVEAMRQIPSTANENWSAFQHRPEQDDPVTLQAIEASRASMAALEAGAKRKDCDWGLKSADGLAALTAGGKQAQEISTLARVFGFSIRYHLEKGNHEKGLREFVAAVLWCRRLASEGESSRRLASLNAEGYLLSYVCSSRCELTPRQLRALRDAYSQLPPRPPLSTCVRFEKECLLAVGTEMKAGDNGTDLKTRFAGGLAPMSINPHYDRAMVVIDMPWEKFVPTWSALVDAPSANPIVKTLKPLKKLKEGDVRSSSVQAMFVAVIAVRLEGEGALAAHPDPFDGKPFGFSKLARNWLVSRCPSDGNDEVGLSVRHP